ncbi:MAG: hypothetical protein NWF09_08980 [Candidatus Bathyarchaeota archaeon]|nr:hypothetical protein [Candidatus Bathyarchaeota archaeon]
MKKKFIATLVAAGVLGVIFGVTSLLTAAIYISLVCYAVLKMIRAESPEEQTRAQRVLVGAIIAGILMGIAKPIAFWASGNNWGNAKYSQQGDVYYIDINNNNVFDANEPNIPAALFNAANRFLDLVMYLGIVVLIAGILYGAIQMRKRH